MVTSGLISFLNPGFSISIDRDREGDSSGSIRRNCCLSFHNGHSVSYAGSPLFLASAMSLWRIGDAARKARVADCARRTDGNETRIRKARAGTRIISPQGNAEAVSVLSAC